MRCIVVEGICHVCNKYWEMIPTQTSQDLLYKLIQSHARDGASADVRLTVVHVSHILFVYNLSIFHLFVFGSCLSYLEFLIKVS